MSGKKLRFGIIGPGAIAKVHSYAISCTDGAELTAVYGRNPAVVDTFATAQGIAGFSDLDQFLNSGLIDAVSIATASGTHLELATQAAQCGKHILCEKPLEVTSQRTEQLISICAQQQVKLGVYFQARFDECTQLAKQAIAQGRLGKLLFASCQMRWFRSQDYYDSAAWRGTWALDGGGCLMNQGIHSIDLLLYLAGQPASVFAWQGPITHQRIEVEDNLCAAVRFKNGAVGTVEASTSCAPGFPRRIEISGEKGSIAIEGDQIVRWEFVDPRPEDQTMLAETAGSVGGAADPTAIGMEGHRLVVADFVSSIQENREPLINGFEGKKAVDLICAVYVSLRSGAAVCLA